MPGAVQTGAHDGGSRRPWNVLARNQLSYLQYERAPLADVVLATLRSFGP